MSFSSNEFTELAKVVDTFDFSLVKNSNNMYVLELTAMHNKQNVSKRSVVLSTSDLSSAITEAVEYVKGSIKNEIVPGIKLLDPDGGLKLTVNQDIILKPHIDQQEVVRGIKIAEEEVSGCEDCKGCGIKLVESDEDDLPAEFVRELLDAFMTSMGQ